MPLRPVSTVLPRRSGSNSRPSSQRPIPNPWEGGAVSRSASASPACPPADKYLPCRCQPWPRGVVCRPSYCPRSALSRGRPSALIGARAAGWAGHDATRDAADSVGLVPAKSQPPLRLAVSPVQPPTRLPSRRRRWVLRAVSGGRPQANTAPAPARETVENALCGVVGKLNKVAGTPTLPQLPPNCLACTPGRKVPPPASIACL